MKTRWQVIVAVTLICVLMFFVTKSVLAKYKVEKPLISVLENHSAVLGFEIEENKDTTNIYISLNGQGEVIKIHKELEKTISSILNHDFTIIYQYEKPKEGTKEWEKYWRVNVIISQAIDTRNYTEAINSLEQTIGDDNFYFIIENSQLFFYYEIEEKMYFSVYNLERGA